MTTQQAVTRIDNPFGNGQNAVASRSNSALIDTESQRAIAEVQAALAIAKRFPRDRIAAVDRILNDCQRSGLAEAAVYQYARGGASVSGPTIRLAESLAQNWGNIQFGVRELSQANGESTVEAFAWDMETNTRQTKIFQVPHRRDNGSILKSPRDIYEHVSNNGQRRVRACILGLIPGDVVDAALTQCEQTLKAHADTSSQGLQKLVRAFEAYGVTKEMIEKRIQCRIDAIKPAQVVSLTKIGTSLREGMSNADDWFDMTLQSDGTGSDKKASSSVDSINSKINGVTHTEGEAKRRNKKPEIVEAADENQAATEKPEQEAKQSPEPAEPSERMQKLLEQIAKAKNGGEVQGTMRYTNGLNEAELDVIKTAMIKRNRELASQQPQKLSLAERIQRETDSDELSILASEIDLIENLEARQKMWDTYNQRLDELNQ